VKIALTQGSVILALTIIALNRFWMYLQVAHFDLNLTAVEQPPFVYFPVDMSVDAKGPHRLVCLTACPNCLLS
jgi:hypothetical protein